MKSMANSSSSAPPTVYTTKDNREGDDLNSSVMSGSNAGYSGSYSRRLNSSSNDQSPARSSSAKSLKPPPPLPSEGGGSVKGILRMPTLQTNITPEMSQRKVLADNNADLISADGSMRSTKRSASTSAYYFTDPMDPTIAQTTVPSSGASVHSANSASNRRVRIQIDGEVMQPNVHHPEDDLLTRRTIRQQGMNQGPYRQMVIGGSEYQEEQQFPPNDQQYYYEQQQQQQEFYNQNPQEFGGNDDDEIYNGELTYEQLEELHRYQLKLEQQQQLQYQQEQERLQLIQSKHAQPSLQKQYSASQQQQQQVQKMLAPSEPPTNLQIPVSNQRRPSAELQSSIPSAPAPRIPVRSSNASTQPSVNQYHNQYYPGVFQDQYAVDQYQSQNNPAGQYTRDIQPNIPHTTEEMDFFYQDEYGNLIPVDMEHLQQQEQYDAHNQQDDYQQGGYDDQFQQYQEPVNPYPPSKVPLPSKSSSSQANFSQQSAMRINPREPMYERTEDQAYYSEQSESMPYHHSISLSRHTNPPVQPQQRVANGLPTQNSGAKVLVHPGSRQQQSLPPQSMLYPPAPPQQQSQQQTYPPYPGNSYNNNNPYPNIPTNSNRQHIRNNQMMQNEEFDNFDNMSQAYEIE
jgi:hypothetical protein